MQWRCKHRKSGLSMTVGEAVCGEAIWSAVAADFKDLVTRHVMFTAITESSFCESQ